MRINNHKTAYRANLEHSDIEKDLLGINSLLVKETSSPKGNDRSPESNVPRSNVVFLNGLDQKLQRKVATSFSPLYVNGAFCCHGNQSFDPICPKTLCSLSPIPMMLHKKFDQDWPTGFRDIQVQKCEMFGTQGQVTPK